MEILFVGLGSIACRHLRNICEVLKESFRITILRSGTGRDIPLDLIDKIDTVVGSDADLNKFYDVIFITNPTFLHYESLKKYIEYSDAFFIEKPVFVTGKEDISLFNNRKKTFYVACPLRYSNVIQWLKENIDYRDVYSARAISSSYLPDWRTGIDYRKCYSASKEMGGGVSIDLIHEWDYLCYLFGYPRSVKSIISKKSNLEIDSDDVAVYIADYDDKIVEIHLDYFGRKAIRRLELIMEEDTIIADLIDQKIYWLKSGKEIELREDRDSYQKKELKHFFDIVSKRVKSDNTIEEACRVLQIARGVE